MTSKTKGVFIFSLLFFMGSFVMLGWVWYEVNEAAASLFEQAKVIADKSAREQKFKEFSVLVEETGVERDALMFHVLTGDQTISFLSDIERIAKQQGVELTTNSLTVSETGGDFDALAITFSVSGREVVIDRMIRIFETLPYHGNITRLQLSRGEDENGFSIMAGTIKLTVSLSNYD